MLSLKRRKTKSGRTTPAAGNATSDNLAVETDAGTPRQDTSIEEEGGIPDSVSALVNDASLNMHSRDYSADNAYVVSGRGGSAGREDITMPLDMGPMDDMSPHPETHSRSRSMNSSMSMSERFGTFKAIRRHVHGSVSSASNSTLTSPTSATIPALGQALGTMGGLNSAGPSQSLQSGLSASAQTDSSQKIQVTNGSKLPRVNGLNYLPGTIIPIQSRFYQANNYSPPVDPETVSHLPPGGIDATSISTTSGIPSAKGSTFANPMLINVSNCNIVIPDSSGNIKIDANSDYYLCSSRCTACNAVFEECWCGDEDLSVNQKEEQALEQQQRKQQQLQQQQQQLQSTAGASSGYPEKKASDSNYGTIRKGQPSAPQGGRSTLSRKLSYSLGSNSGAMGVNAGNVPIGTNAQIEILSAANILTNPLAGNLVVNDPFGYYYLNHHSVLSLPQVSGNSSSGSSASIGTLGRKARNGSNGNTASNAHLQSLFDNSESNAANSSIQASPNTSPASEKPNTLDNTSNNRSSSNSNPRNNTSVGSNGTTNLNSATNNSGSLGSVKSDVQLCDIVRSLRRQVSVSSEINISKLGTPANGPLTMAPGLGGSLQLAQSKKKSNKQRSTSVGHIGDGPRKESVTFGTNSPALLQSEVSEENVLMNQSSFLTNEDRADSDLLLSNNTNAFEEVEEGKDQGAGSLDRTSESAKEYPVDKKQQLKGAEEDDFLCSLPRRTLSSVGGTPVFDTEILKNRESSSSINSTENVVAPSSPSVKSVNIASGTRSGRSDTKHKSGLSSLASSAADINSISEQKVYITSSGGLCRKYNISGAVPTQESIPELPLRNSILHVNYSGLADPIKDALVNRNMREITNQIGASTQFSLKSQLELQQHQQQQDSANGGVVKQGELRLTDVVNDTIYRTQYVVIVDYIISFFEEDASATEGSAPKLLFEIPTERCVAFVHNKAGKEKFHTYKQDTDGKTTTDLVGMKGSNFKKFTIVYDGGQVDLIADSESEANLWAATINTASSNISFAVSLASRLSHEAEYYREYNTLVTNVVRDISANERYLTLKRTVEDEVRSLRDEISSLSDFSAPRSDRKKSISNSISSKNGKDRNSRQSLFFDDCDGKNKSLKVARKRRGSARPMSSLVTSTDVTESQAAVSPVDENSGSKDKETEKEALKEAEKRKSAESEKRKSVESEKKDEKPEPVYVLDSNVVLPHLAHLTRLQQQDTLHAKIEYLTGIPSPRPSHLQTFMQTYRCFSSTEEIVSHLKARLHLKPPRADATPEQLAFVLKFQPLIRLRVCRFVMDWLSPNIGAFGMVPAKDNWEVLREFLQYLLESCTDSDSLLLSGSSLSSYSSIANSSNVHRSDSIIEGTTSESTSFVNVSQSSQAPISNVSSNQQLQQQGSQGQIPQSATQSAHQPNSRRHSRRTSSISGQHNGASGPSGHGLNLYRHGSSNSHGNELRIVEKLLTLLIDVRKDAVSEKLSEWEKEDRIMVRKREAAAAAAATGGSNNNGQSGANLKNKEKVFSFELFNRINEKNVLFLSDVNPKSKDLHGSLDGKGLPRNLASFATGPANVASSAANVYQKFQFSTIPEIDLKQLAVAFTVVDLNRLSRITIQGLVYPLVLKKLNDKWTKRVTKAVDDMVNSFNRTSHWVATEICTQPQLKPRTKVIEKMIKLAKELKNLDNYDSCLAIISGLNMASVSRLRQTWAAVDPHRLKQMQQLEQFLSPTQNYKSYRSYVSTLAPGSYIPILSIILKDLYFLTDANEKTPSVGRSVLKAIRNSGVLPRSSVNSLPSGLIQNGYALSSLTVGYQQGGNGGYNMDYGYGLISNASTGILSNPGVANATTRVERICTTQQFTQQQISFMQSKAADGLPLVAHGYAVPLSFSPGFPDSARSWKFTEEGIGESLGINEESLDPTSSKFADIVRPLNFIIPETDFLYAGKLRYIESSDSLWKYSTLCEKANNAASQPAPSVAAAAVAAAQAQERLMKEQQQRIEAEEKAAAARAKEEGVTETTGDAFDVSDDENNSDIEDTEEPSTAVNIDDN